MMVGQQEYPNNRRGAPGDVRLEFVIDSLGRADPCSFRVLDATDDKFVGSAYRTVLGSQFRPAEKGGQHVAIRVTQKVSFRP